MDKQTEKVVDRISQTLTNLLAAHEQLLELLLRKRQALRRADRDGLAECCRLENQKVQQIAELEKQRQTLAAEWTLLLAPAAPKPMRLGELAESLPEPARGKLLVLRQQLRARMERVVAETTIVRKAAEALSRHMQGIIQAIGVVCSGGGVYGRAGAPAKATMVVQTFNTTA